MFAMSENEIVMTQGNHLMLTKPFGLEFPHFWKPKPIEGRRVHVILLWRREKVLWHRFRKGRTNVPTSSWCISKFGTAISCPFGTTVPSEKVKSFRTFLRMVTALEQIDRKGVVKFKKELQNVQALPAPSLWDSLIKLSSFTILCNDIFV